MFKTGKLKLLLLLVNYQTYQSNPDFDVPYSKELKWFNLKTLHIHLQ